MNANELVRNYAISVDDTDMYITILRNGKTYFTNYDKGLYEIMKSGIFTAARTNGSNKGDYLKFSCTHSDVKAYFHHIVFCYYYRGLTQNNYIDVLTAFSEEISRGNLNVDHLQNSVFNNRKWNLSLMTKVENSQKVKLNKRFKDIFDLVLSFDGEGYRVQLTYFNKGIRCVRYYCNTPDELNRLCRYLQENKWKLRKAKAGVAQADNLYFASGDFENYFSRHFFYIATSNEIIDAQRKLLEMDKIKFCKKKL